MRWCHILSEKHRLDHDHLEHILPSFDDMSCFPTVVGITTDLLEAATYPRAPFLITSDRAIEAKSAGTSNKEHEFLLVTLMDTEAMLGIVHPELAQRPEAYQCFQRLRSIRADRQRGHITVTSAHHFHSPT
jgi:hypothetical protein